MNSMGKQGKKRQGSTKAEDNSGTGSVATEEHRVVQGLSDDGSKGSDFCSPLKDSHFYSPSGVPDLCIPQPKKVKKRKINGESEDAAPKGDTKKESVQPLKKWKTNYGSEDAAPNGNTRESMPPVRNKRKISCESEDAGQEGDAKEKKEKKTKKKKKKMSECNDIGMLNNGQNGIATVKGRIKQDNSNNGENGIASDEGLIEQDFTSGGSGVPELGKNPLNEKIKKKKKKSHATDGSGQDVGDSCHHPTGGSVSKEGVRRGDPSIPDLIVSLSKKGKTKIKSIRQKSLWYDNMGNAHGDKVRDKSGLKGDMEHSPLKVPEPLTPASGKELKKKKKVRFQEPGEDVPKEIMVYVPPEMDVEGNLAYFSEDRGWKKDFARTDLVYGRYTKDEDEKIKSSVYGYITMRGWGLNEGLEILFHSAKHRREAHGCWLDIAKCLPTRPVKQIYVRALRILGSQKRGAWLPDELEMLKQLVDLHGHKWRQVAELMDRSEQDCRCRWRKLKMIPTRKTGLWTQDDLDKICKLVRRSLRIKALIPGKTCDRRLVRDDINWEWISTEMQRDSARCAATWYDRLASPLMCQKLWAVGDDRSLLQSLMELAPSSEEAVDWDCVLAHRDGKVCLDRWKEMTRQLEKRNHLPFEDKVEALAKRFCPDLLGIEEELI